MRRRRWHGLEVTLLDTRAGATRVDAGAEHRVGLHVGRPVRAQCRLDGRAQRRIQVRGDIDLVPAGSSGVWEDDRSTQVLLLAVTPALIDAAAHGLGLDPARVGRARRRSPSRRDRPRRRAAGPVSATVRASAHGLRRGRLSSPT